MQNAAAAREFLEGEPLLYGADAILATAESDLEFGVGKRSHHDRDIHSGIVRGVAEI